MWKALIEYWPFRRSRHLLELLTMASTVRLVMSPTNPRTFSGPTSKVKEEDMWHIGVVFQSSPCKYRTTILEIKDVIHVIIIIQTIFSDNLIKGLTWLNRIRSSVVFELSLHSASPWNFRRPEFVQKRTSNFSFITKYNCVDPTVSVVSKIFS